MTEMKKSMPIKILKITLGIIVAGLVMGTVVMLLWNWLIPTIFVGGPEISFIQALGLLLLSRLLFGGMKMGEGRGKCHYRKGRREEWKRTWTLGTDGAKYTAEEKKDEEKSAE